MKQLLFVCPLQ